LSLATLGLAGGLLPSPSALLLFLAALVADRPAFGVVLVVTFGAGMALTLAGAGLAATGLLTLIERAVSRQRGVSGALRVLVAYGAATGVCAVGLGLMLRTAWTL
jgi:ABC-type nickel/cobalt efflux system permease component RcnA